MEEEGTTAWQREKIKQFYSQDFEIFDKITATPFQAELYKTTELAKF
jgi:hypothetical protein